MERIFIASGEMHAQQVRAFLEAAGIPTAVRGEALRHTHGLTIDGLGGGFWAMPELADLRVTHSGRGYQPMPVSHHRADWWSDHVRAPAPRYPWLFWRGRLWNRPALRSIYRPWRAAERRGVDVHIGEFGCFNRTPNDIAMRWLTDLLSIYREFGWGYAMWNFRGAFGIVEHGRPGARFECLAGYHVDRALLELMLENRAG